MPAAKIRSSIIATSIQKSAFMSGLLAHVVSCPPALVPAGGVVSYRWP
jgi:hypothetical protein